MLHTTVKKIKYGSLVQSLTLCAFLAFIFSCSGGGGDYDGKSSSGSGSIVFGLAVQEDSDAQVSSIALAQAESQMDCDYHNIEWVIAEVYDSNGLLIVRGPDWPCHLHEGKLEDVPIGKDYKLVVRTIAKDSDDYNYKGEIEGITVTLGQEKKAGTVTLWPLNPPPKVEGLTATKGEYETRIKLTWADVSSREGYCSEDGYDVYRGETEDGVFEFIGDTEADITEYFDDDLPCTPRFEGAQEYYYKVVAWNKITGEEKLESVDSDTDYGSTGVCAMNRPLPVEYLTATKGDHQDRIILTWEWYDTESINGFRISRGTNPTDPSTWTVLEEAYAPTSRRYEDIGHDCTPRGGDPQSFWYEVVAHNRIGDSVDNPTVEGYTDICPIEPPPPAFDLSASDGELEKSIKLNWQWQGEGPLDGFNLYRSQTESGTYEPIGTVGASIREYFDSGLDCTPGGDDPQSFWYKVKAFNSAGESGDSNADSGYTDICPIEPPAPAKELEASDGEFGDSIELTWEWSGSGPLEGFRIYRSENEIGGTLPPVLERVAPSSRTYTDSDVPCTPRLKDSPKLYWYLVVPYNSEGPSTTSDGSDMDSGYMRVPDNVTLQASPVYPGEIKLEWNDVDNADGYDIFRTTDPDVSPDWPRIDTVSAGTTTWVDDDSELGCSLWYYSVVPYSCAGYADYLDDSGHIDSTVAEGCDYYPE